MDIITTRASDIPQPEPWLFLNLHDEVPASFIEHPKVWRPKSTTVSISVPEQLTQAQGFARVSTVDSVDYRDAHAKVGVDQRYKARAFQVPPNGNYMTVVGSAGPESKDETGMDRVFLQPDRSLLGGFVPKGAGVPRGYGRNGGPPPPPAPSMSSKSSTSPSDLYTPSSYTPTTATSYDSATDVAGIMMPTVYKNSSVMTSPNAADRGTMTEPGSRRKDLRVNTGRFQVPEETEVADQATMTDAVDQGTMINLQNYDLAQIFREGVNQGKSLTEMMMNATNAPIVSRDISHQGTQTYPIISPTSPDTPATLPTTQNTGPTSTVPIHYAPPPAPTSGLQPNVASSPTLSTFEYPSAADPRGPTIIDLTGVQNNNATGLQSNGTPAERMRQMNPSAPEAKPLNSVIDNSTIDATKAPMRRKSAPSAIPKYPASSSKGSQNKMIRAAIVAQEKNKKAVVSKTKALTPEMILTVSGEKQYAGIKRPAKKPAKDMVRPPKKSKGSGPAKEPKSPDDPRKYVLPPAIPPFSKAKVKARKGSVSQPKSTPVTSIVSSVPTDTSKLKTLRMSKLKSKAKTASSSKSTQQKNKEKKQPKPRRKS